MIAGRHHGGSCVSHSFHERKTELPTLRNANGFLLLISHCTVVHLQTDVKKTSITASASLSASRALCRHSWRWSRVGELQYKTWVGKVGCRGVYHTARDGSSGRMERKCAPATRADGCIHSTKRYCSCSPGLNRVDPVIRNGLGKGNSVQRLPRLQLPQICGGVNRTAVSKEFNSKRKRVYLRRYQDKT